MWLILHSCTAATTTMSKMVAVGIHIWICWWWKPICVHLFAVCLYWIEWKLLPEYIIEHWTLKACFRFGKYVTSALTYSWCLRTTNLHSSIMPAYDKVIGEWYVHFALCFLLSVLCLPYVNENRKGINFILDMQNAKRYWCYKLVLLESIYLISYLFLYWMSVLIELIESTHTYPGGRW